MSLTEDDVLQILELFAASDWDEMALTSGDVRLNVSKRGGATQLLAAPAAGPAVATVAPAPVTPPAPPAATAPSAPSAAPATPAPPEAAAVDEEPPPGIVAVRSPTLGTFFVAPKPGAPPFVQPGDTVAAGATVGIVEVMKLMNPVQVEVAGEIVKVCARNNELVEYDRILFWLKPEGQ